MKRHLTALAIAVVLTVVAGAAWAYWSAGSTPGGNGAAAATTVNQGATPSASATGASVTVSWSATTLANGQAVSGYLVKRYHAGTDALQTILSACTGTIATTSCVENSVPDGSWKYTVTPVFATNWQGAESAKSTAVVVSSDSTAPTNSITLSSVTGGAHLSGTTVYYNGAAGGSLSLTNAVADAGSGPASSATAALTGTTTGWSHTPSTVSTPAGGPYVSNPFSWAAATTSGPGEAVTGRDVAGNSTVANLTFTNDSAAPTGASISYADGYSSGRSATLTLTNGTDAGSGVATRQLQRATAALTGTTCGAFGGFSNLGAVNPASPYVDSSLAAGCYKYRYVVTDRVGNQDIATSGSVVKIGYAAAVDATPGILSHWRLGEATQNLVSTDAFTGTSGSSLAAHSDGFGTIWNHQAGGANAVISDANRVRRSGLAGYTIDYVNATPPSADYSVEADLDVMSNLASDYVGVIGRLNTANTSFYMARWEQSPLFGTTGVWRLARYGSGTATSLAVSASQAQPVVGETYRIRLEMIGTSLALYVNGVLKVSATDATLSAAGRAGIMDGTDGLSSAKGNTTGLHLDDFQVTPSTYARAADDKGSNTGDYENGVTVGATGALGGDSNTAATFDGVNDYVQMTNTTGFPTGAAIRSTEAWFKTSSSARQVLFRYGTGVNLQEYGLWIDAGGTTMTAWGFGNGNDKVFTMPSAVNNGDWHHVVQTYNGTSITLYIDGTALTPQAATRATVMDMYGFGIGAIIRPSDGNSGGFFSGSIDEVSFYTSVLTQAQVTDHHQLGLAPAVDVTGPTGGSVDASGLVGTGSRYSTSTTLSLVLAKGTDPSGVATSGNEVKRATATLTNGTCGSFGGYSLVTGGSDPSSPLADSVADQACYSYRYIVLDTLGNASTYTSPDIKVDTTAPAAPTLAFSAFTNTWWPGSGATVYYRSAATSGSFTTTASASDAASGITSYSFPGLGTNWTSTPGALGVNTYSWAGAPAAPGTKNVTATNNATLSSANAPFTLTADDTAPTAGTVTYTDTTQSTATVSVAFTTGTDAASGIGTRLLQRASATLTGGTCGSYGAFATIAGGTNPGSSPVVDTVPASACYTYQYVVSDNVGNTHTATSASVVKVNLPCSSQLVTNGGFEGGTGWTQSPAGVVTNAALAVPARTGTWRALLGGQGATATETVSQSVTIPANCGATLTYWLRVTTAEAPGTAYDFFSVLVNGTPQTDVWSNTDSGLDYVQRTVNLSSYAGQTVTLTFQSVEDFSLQTSFWLDDVAINTTDSTGPTGGSVDASGLVGTGSRYATSTTLSLVLDKGTDPSGLAATGNTLSRATATLTGGSCGTFGGYTLITGGTDPVSPKSDSVSDQACYSYRYIVKDTLGNATTYTSPDIKVDTTAPAAPSLAFSAFTNTWWPGSGSTVYYRSAAASGSVTVTGTTTDAASGIASYAFPALGTNWTSTPGALGVSTYSWSGAPAAPGTNNLTATNNAALASANAPFTMTADDTAPTAGTVSYADGSTSGTTVSVSFTTGTDGGSGLGTRLLQRAAAPVTGGTTCGAYGAFATVTNGTNPTSPVTDTITPGNCYQYRYVVPDNVGNQHIATNANVAHTAFGAHWTFDAGSGTTATDSTGNGHTATLQAGATWTAGKIGANALNLNGTTQYASAAAPVIDTSQSYSVAAWVRPSSITGGNKTAVSMDGTSISPFYLMVQGGGQYRVELRHSDSTASAATAATGVAAAVNTWAHLVMVHDNAANTVSLYVDGVLRNTVAFNSPWKANGVTTVGRAKWNGGPVDFFAGAIDDVRLYDYALSAGEVDVLVPAVNYGTTIDATTGLLNYYRLGEATTSADSMAGSTGATLQSRSGEIGATWTKHASSTGDAVLTNAGRVRKTGAALGALYYTSAAPATADYTVEADVRLAGTEVTNDIAGVVGRVNTGATTYYVARYEQSGHSWNLHRVVNNTWTHLGSAAQTITSGTTYRLALDMTGTNIRVLVDGTQVISATDAGIAPAGRGGLAVGFHASATPTVTDTDGMHLDDFRISPQMADSKGTNPGDYFWGVALGQTGAINGDANTAALFDGTNDVAPATRQIGNDFSIELWFKSTQGVGTGAQWWAGAGLVDADFSGAGNDFGLSLRSDGRVVAGVGVPEVSVVSTAGGYNNGAWHHVVFTRTQSNGALALYIDGLPAGTGTGNTLALTSSATLSLGRVQGLAHLNGTLDEVALYNTVLSAATVAAHHAAGF